MATEYVTRISETSERDESFLNISNSLALVPGCAGEKERGLAVSWQNLVRGG